MNKKLWCHAKNIEAVLMMKKENNIHYFWHQTDDITLTSQGYMWAHPRKQPIENSIAVMPDIYQIDLDIRDISRILHKCQGICSDSINKYR
jgi:hypothetical protein